MSDAPRERSKERYYDKVILDTLSYRAIFKYPLSFYQLTTYLISSKPIDLEFFKKALRKLCKKGKVKIKDNKLYLPRFKPLSWEQRAKQTVEHLSKAQIAFEALKHIPWIKLLAVTGAVAAYSSDKKDDVDVFIITSRGRLWLTRFFVVVILKVLNMYRTETDSSYKICPNIYIDENNLSWEQSKRNVYVAHEIAMMQPIINRDDTYFRFIEKNSWVFEFFSNFKICHESIKKTHIKQSGLLDFVEDLFMKMQLKYMKKHQTKEITKKGFIHFNKTDWMPKVLSEFNKTVS